MKKENIDFPTFEEILFADRNQEYGAFAIRKKYSTNVNKALFISTIVILIMIAIPIIANALRKEIKEEIKISGEFEMTENRDKNVDVLPPPPPPNNDKELKSFAYSVPKIVDSVLQNFTITIDEILEKNNENADSTIVVLKDNGGGDEIIENKIKKRVVVDIVSEMPTFKGGEKEMFRWIHDNLKYPPAASEIGVNGTITVQFVVNSDGSISDVLSLRHISGLQDLEAEAVRVVNKMPKWNPGRQGGTAVNVRFIIPIKFKLEK